MRAPPRARTGARPPLDWHGARNGRTWCGGYNANRMIIQSLLDTDLYKFTMMQVVLHHFPGAQVEYKFKCRSEGIDFRPYLDEMRAEITALRELRFREDELAYLRGLRFMKSDFVDFLALSNSTTSTCASAMASVRARWTSPSAARGCTRSCSRFPCWPSCRRSISAARSRVPISKKA